MYRITIAAALALTLLISAAPQPALGASFAVNATHDAVDAAPGDGACADPSGACTLRAAIMETNALPGGDTITLPPSTYTLAIPGGGEDAGATGDLDITTDLTLIGGGRDSAIVDGGGLDRVFHITGNGTVAIRDLTIRNGAVGTSTTSGSCNPFPDQENGGGLCNASANVSLLRVAVLGSTSTRHGGGIFNTGTMEIKDSVISANLRDAVANGDQFSEGTISLTNSLIADNPGGAIRNYANATLTDTLVLRNSSGVESMSGNVSITGGSVSLNPGMGVRNDGIMTIENLTIHGNGSFGILNNDRAQLTATGTTISANGRGVRNTHGQPIDGPPGGPGTATLTNSTISGNSAFGVENEGNMTLASVTITNNAGPGFRLTERVGATSSEYNRRL